MRESAHIRARAVRYATLEPRPLWLTESAAVEPASLLRGQKSVNWINNVVRPKIRSFLTTKREVPDNMWVKCPETGQMVFYKDLEANQFVVPGSNFHMRMASDLRLAQLFDNGEF